MKKRDPEIGDLVVCTVKDVRDFGVVCSLDEYTGKEGFIHITEVSSGWIKYIRDYVREGKRIVCKVLDANPSRGRFDLSLRRVNDHQKREKLKEWKNEQRAEKIIANLLTQFQGKLDNAAIMDEMEEKFGSLSYALETAAADPEQFSSEMKNKEWASAVVAYAKENLKPPVAEVRGIIKLKHSSGDGIEIIKKALHAGEKEGIEITYLGAPQYRIISRAEDAKIAEENMRKSGEEIVAYIEKHGGTGEGPVKE
ncbi:MAG: translation initiation factor IF-2 subunit alpha [Candidatus Thermoplasmatota archaeon]|jgi:translation initiation factor 2 subunit 1|nr:translation initiation factor IF-2 subunit alpha [Candidatus Thermoplasmatota archaeon]MCL5790213.1 translation initiation factor IF-2 subunit alpha [Candidatus Thermoplasmatota archaeon]